MRKIAFFPFHGEPWKERGFFWFLLQNEAHTNFQFI